MTEFTPLFCRFFQFKAYAKNLENGDIALGFFNFGSAAAIVRVNLDELGLPESTGKTLCMRNVWEDETVTVKNGTIIHDIQPYDCLVYRCSVIDK